MCSTVWSHPRFAERCDGLMACVNSIAFQLVQLERRLEAATVKPSREASGVAPAQSGSTETGTAEATIGEMSSDDADAASDEAARKEGSADRS